ncbi:MAG: hypothetical protein ACPG5Z_00250 [Pseudoalteromonas sp.]
MQTEQHEEIQDDVQETETVETLDANESEAEESSDEIESEESETTEQDDEESAEEDAEKVAAKPKQNGFKKRIDRYKRKVSRANEEVEYWKAQALKVKDQPMTDEKPMKAEGRPVADDYDSHEEFVEAITDWKVDLALKSQTEKQEQKKAESVKEQRAKTWQTRMEAFSEKTPDFEEIMEDANDEKLTGVMTEAILDSDLGPEVLYHLAKNPNEVERIKGLSDLGAVREIGKIEAMISPSKKVTKKITKAPAPLSKSKGGAKFSKDISDKDLPFKEYEALRNKQAGRVL